MSDNDGSPSGSPFKSWPTNVDKIETHFGGRREEVIGRLRLLEEIAWEKNPKSMPQALLQNLGWLEGVEEAEEQFDRLLRIGEPEGFSDALIFNLVSRAQVDCELPVMKAQQDLDSLELYVDPSRLEPLRKIRTDRLYHWGLKAYSILIKRPSGKQALHYLRGYRDGLLVMRDRAQKAKRAAPISASDWVIDGNYSRKMHLGRYVFESGELLFCADLWGKFQFPSCSLTVEDPLSGSLLCEMGVSSLPSENLIYKIPPSLEKAGESLASELLKIQNEVHQRLRETASRTLEQIEVTKLKNHLADILERPTELALKRWPMYKTVTQRYRNYTEQCEGFAGEIVRILMSHATSSFTAAQLDKLEHRVGTSKKGKIFGLF